MKLGDLSKHERLVELLKLFADEVITAEEFWAQMRQYGLSDPDIDLLCRGEQVKK